MYYAKESILLGDGRYWERALRSRPFSTKEGAINLAEKNRKADNQPFVQNGHGTVIHTCKKGGDYK